MGHSSSGDSGWGFDFEREVSCALLVLMAANGCLWLSDEEEIKCVWPQVHKEGMDTDDIRVCLINHQRNTARDLYIQCKSTIKCNMAHDGAFYKAVSRAFSDFAKTDNSVDKVFALACGPLNGRGCILPDFMHAMHVREWDQVSLELAKKHLEPEYEELFSIFCQIAQSCKIDKPVTKAMVHSFLKHYYVFQPDIKFRYGIEESFILSALRHLGATMPEDKINVLRGFVAEKAKARGKVEKSEVMDKLRLFGRQVVIRGHDNVLDMVAARHGQNEINTTDGRKENFDRIGEVARPQLNVLQSDYIMLSCDKMPNESLLESLHGGESLYEYLCCLARRIVNIESRQQACRAAVQLLARQRERGNSGIVFDMFSYLLSPLTPLDAEEDRWRVSLVRDLFRINNDIAWEILCAQVVTERMPPLSFLDIRQSSEFDKDLLREYQKYALGHVGGEPSRVMDLVARLPLVDADFFDSIIACVSSCVLDAAEKDRKAIYGAILDAWTKIVEWPFFSEDRQRRSKTLLTVIKKLFASDYEPLLIAVFGVSDAMPNALNAVRKRLLRRFANEHGDRIEEMLRIANNIRHPNLIGEYLSMIMGTDYDIPLLTVSLQKYKESCVVDVARAYAWGRYKQQGGMRWVNALDIAGWSNNMVAHFYALLPVVPESWHHVESLGSECMDEYWKNVKIYLPPKSVAAECGYVVLQLSECGRTLDSLRMWSFMQCQKVSTPYSMTVAMLEGLVDGTQTVEAMWGEFYRVQAALKNLHASPNIEKNRVARIEWYFNALFAKRTMEYIDASCCSRRMSVDSVFFVNVVRGVSDGVRAPKNVDYSRGEKVLNMWEDFPGMSEDGRACDKDFQLWFNRVVVVTENDEVCKNKCLKWIGMCLAKQDKFGDTIFSIKSIWRLVESAEGCVIRNEFETTLKNKALLPHLLLAGGGVSLKNSYYQLGRAAKELGYTNVAASYERAYQYLKGMQPLA